MRQTQLAKTLTGVALEIPDQAHQAARILAHVSGFRFVVRRVCDNQE
jgi:hypothetical protein